jgi:hypothetical protein
MGRARHVGKRPPPPRPAQCSNVIGSQECLKCVPPTPCPDESNFAIRIWRLIPRSSQKVDRHVVVSAHYL